MQLKDADELKKFMERMLCTGKEPDKERYTCDVVCCVIDEVPSVDAEPVRHGRWIYDPNGMDFNLGAWVCSECKERNNNLGGMRKINPYQFVGSRFCPNCGAKMDGGSYG